MFLVTTGGGLEARNMCFFYCSPLFSCQQGRLRPVQWAWVDACDCESRSGLVPRGWVASRVGSVIGGKFPVLHVPTDTDLVGKVLLVLVDG